jgi:hypothetical protein
MQSADAYWFHKNKQFLVEQTLLYGFCTDLLICAGQWVDGSSSYVSITEGSEDLNNLKSLLLFYGINKNVSETISVVTAGNKETSGK